MATRRLITDENLKRFGINVKNSINSITTKADAAAEKANAAADKADTATANANAATGKANTAATNADTATQKANDAATASEKVNATITAENVLEVTNRSGEKKSLDLSALAAANSMAADVERVKMTLGRYTPREDIVLTPVQTNYAISADGVKVSKSGWAIAEFEAEKGNEYLFKPNITDGSVCIFAEKIDKVETRAIDYTYTYNEDGTIASATATYGGKTYVYSYEYSVDSMGNTVVTITDDTGLTMSELPYQYQTTVGSYSPLVRLNAGAELPEDGYCRFMSHFQGNSALKVAVSYKVGTADLTMKVTRDGVLASVSTQLGNLSHKEDETRKKIDELHGNWVDVLFLADTTVYVDNKETIIKGRVRTRLYPKIQLQFGGQEYGPYITLLWVDFSHLTLAIKLSIRRFGNEQGFLLGCNKIQSLDLNNLDISKNVNLRNMFKGCSSLQSLSIEGWDVSKVTDMNQIFFGCSSLQSLDLSGWNLESCKNIDYLGQYSFSPKTLKLGTGFFKCPATKASLHFATWTDASVKESLVVNSYDRKANGLPDFTITLHANTKKVLTEDDIAAMTAKGYIIA